jgi:hypothetical protein
LQEKTPQKTLAIPGKPAIIRLRDPGNRRDPGPKSGPETARRRACNQIVIFFFKKLLQFMETVL